MRWGWAGWDGVGWGTYETAGLPVVCLPASQSLSNGPLPLLLRPPPPPLPPASLPLSHSPLLFSPPSSLPPSPPLPQIVADDVKCTHGCTVSDLEEEELFYLRWARCACCAAPAVVGGVAGIVTRGGAHCAWRARCGWLGLCCAVSPIKHHVHAPPAPIGSPYTPASSPGPPPLPPNVPGCRARGISAEMARQMLVYSFGREVVQALRDDALQGRVEAAVTATLAGFVSAAVAP